MIWYIITNVRVYLFHLKWKLILEAVFLHIILLHSVNFALELQCTCWFSFIFYLSHNVYKQFLGWNSLSQSLSVSLIRTSEFWCEASVREVFVNINMNLICKNCIIYCCHLIFKVCFFALTGIYLYSLTVLICIPSCHQVSTLVSILLV